MDKLKEILAVFDELGDLSLLKRDGKDFSFSDIHHLILETYNKLQQIIKNPEFWSLVPENVQNNSIDPFQNIANLAGQIKNFNPITGATQGTRDSIASQIRSYYSQLYDPVFVPLDTFLVKYSLSTGDIQNLSQEARNVLEEIQKQKIKGEDLLTAIQKTAAVGGTSKFAGIFSKEALKHSIIGYIWLTITIVATGYMLWFLDDTFRKLTEALKNITAGGDSVSVILQLFFAKVLILSFLSVVFYQIVKNYNANMHLSIINKHRENSLKTFQAFVESTNDPKTKDIILVQSTQTIFTAGDTGYVSSRDGSNPSFDAVKIIESGQK